ncbi:hypothetical protein ACX8XN_10105 [Calditrichota bacterium GD2]
MATFSKSNKEAKSLKEKRDVLKRSSLPSKDKRETRFALHCELNIDEVINQTINHHIGMGAII